LRLGGKPKVKEDEAKKAREAALDKLLDECEAIAEEAKRAGAQAEMLRYFCNQANHLERLLNSVRFHWDNAGQRLVHPIGGKIEWNDFTIEKCLPLGDELSNFKIQYQSHLDWLAIVLPGFSSPSVTSGYPNADKEYPDVLAELKFHAEVLDRTAKRIWESGTHEEALDSKPQ
jgi:hypothetical protein